MKYKRPVDQPMRLATSNEVLGAFAPETTLRIDRGHVVVCWRSHAKRWMTRGGQDFYPVWHREWGHGGTASTALSQLVRWIKGLPVLPLGTWRYWGGERVALLRQRQGAEAAIIALERAGYPAKVPCVLCQRELAGAMDWWSLDGVSGPCCCWTQGCRQKLDHKTA